MSELVGIAKPSLRNLRGFTLMELMISVAVLSILIAIAIPSFHHSILLANLKSQSSELVAGAVLARSEAIKRNQAVRLCSSSDGTTCSGTWTNGWIVISAGDTVIHAHNKPAPTGFLISSAVTSITFSANGLGASATTLTICRATPSAGPQERVVSVNAAGKASITKTETGICS